MHIVVTYLTMLFSSVIVQPQNLVSVNTLRCCSNTQSYGKDNRFFDNRPFGIDKTLNNVVTFKPMANVHSVNSDCMDDFLSELDKD